MAKKRKRPSAVEEVQRQEKINKNASQVRMMQHFAGKFIKVANNVRPSNLDPISHQANPVGNVSKVRGGCHPGRFFPRQPNHWASQPPSTLSEVPVVNFAESEHR